MESFIKGFGEKTYLINLIFIRVGVGYLFLSAGLQKLHGGFVAPGNLAKFLSKSMAPPWYSAFIHNVVIPNETIFAYLVLFGEIAVGICLILGLFTRYASLAALLMNLNYFIASQGAPGGPQMNTILMACDVAIFLSGAGVALGLDSILRTRLKRWI